MEQTLEVSGFPAGWYAAFHDGDRPHWWWPLCRPGFRHVLVFGFCVHAEAWLIYDVTERRTFVRALKPEAFRSWLANLPEHRRILHLEIPAEGVKPAFRLGFWCTPAAAHLLGVRSRALRPQGLYRDLIAQGARPAFESESP